MIPCLALGRLYLPAIIIVPVKLGHLKGFKRDHRGLEIGLCGLLQAGAGRKDYSQAEKKDDTFKETQQKRIKAQYAGMQQTDRMGKVILKAYGQETFSKFFKAML